MGASGVGSHSGGGGDLRAGAVPRRQRPEFHSENNGASPSEERRDAIFSRDLVYRYALTIDWFWADLFAMEDRAEADKIAALGCRTLMVCAMNPSTADAFKNDPTVRRMIGFGRSWGFGRLVVTNVMAYRSTDPKALPTDLDEAMGPFNLEWLQAEAADADLILMAYGALKGMHKIAAEMAEARLMSCGHNLYRLSSKPYPRHPLYAPGADTAELWRAAA